MINDKQQEVIIRPVLVTLQYNGDYNVPNELQHMYHIYVNNLLFGLSIGIKHIKMD